MRPSVRLTRLTMPAVLLAGLITAVPAAEPASAASAPAPDYEAPFPCGTEWVGTTRADHSPSRLSVDFNREGDLGALTVATAPGVVTRVADTGTSSYGKYLFLDHGNGNTSTYAHLLTQQVSTGQRVDQGTVLGLVGSSGGTSGAHLHFEERLGGTVQAPYFHQRAYVFGTTLSSANCPDVPIAGDWNGNGRDDLGVYRHRSGVGVFRLRMPSGRVRPVGFGSSADTPVTGDWDGDGRTEVGVRQAGTNVFALRRADGSVRFQRFGAVADTPVTGDWDGDGATDVGLWRSADGLFRLRLASGEVRRVVLGAADAIPVAGDWDGNGSTDVGVFEPRSGVFRLRALHRDGPASAAFTVVFGTGTDLPVAGDWNGNGRGDLGVWGPETARFAVRRSARAASDTPVSSVAFGLARRG